eukprot:3775887-Pyramimonas_sp.AAC.1
MGARYDFETGVSQDTLSNCMISGVRAPHYAPERSKTAPVSNWGFRKNCKPNCAGPSREAPL